MKRPNSLNAKTNILLLAISAILVAAILVSHASACFVRSPQPVQVWVDHVEIEIVDGVAVKTYDCAFLNPNKNAVVGGECYMELEPGARVSSMSVVVNGKKVEGEILDVKRANKVFEEMVKENKSPALLEYYGNQLIRTKVPRIEPGKTVKVKLQYTVVLDLKDDLVRIQCLNTNPKADMKPLKEASVRVKIKSKTPLKNVYSPTHEIKIVEEPDWDVIAEWSQKDYLPTHPFVLYYQLAEQPIGATLLAHREPGEDGHFMLMLSPTLGDGPGAVQERDILPKDVIFCVDSSGSMLEGKKMEQARSAIKECLGLLRRGDRFNIVDFGTGVRTLQREGLLPADETSIDKAERYADKLAPRGGTAIDEALSRSLELLGDDSGRLKMILFATDGKPTIGERSPEAILARMQKRDQAEVRLFTFGQGYDVNSQLLDFLAFNHRGVSEYVLPEEDLQAKITKFFGRVGSPLMTDVTFEIVGVETYDVFPSTIADVHKGEQIVIFGRYKGQGAHTVRITGYSGDKQSKYEYVVALPQESTDEKQAFVPRLWAGQKVDALLNEIRKRGKESPELESEVTYLAKRYGVVTPFTSFLMVEETVNDVHAKQVRHFSGRLRNEGNLLANQTGKIAVTNAWRQANNRALYQGNGGGQQFYNDAQLALQQEGRGDQALAAVRYVNNRCFFNQRGVWYDSRFDDTKQPKVQNVVVGSKTYLELLHQNPKLAPYMAQGDVVVEAGGNWYRFESRG